MRNFSHGWLIEDFISLLFSQGLCCSNWGEGGLQVCQSICRSGLHMGAQLCPTPFNPVDCSPPGSFVHRIFPRILEWAAVSYSRGSNSHLLHLLHWQVDSLPVLHLGSPCQSGDTILCKCLGNQASYIKMFGCTYKGLPRWC